MFTKPKPSDSIRLIKAWFMGQSDITSKTWHYSQFLCVCVCVCVGECMSPLGMESGEITEDRISASSQYNPSWSPLRSRLNFPDNGWTPSEDSAREWIQVQTHTHSLVNHYNLKMIVHPYYSFWSLHWTVHSCIMKL